jgi:hypothetical protein
LCFVQSSIAAEQHDAPVREGEALVVAADARAVTGLEQSSVGRMSKKTVSVVSRSSGTVLRVISARVPGCSRQTAMASAQSP